MQLTYWYIFSFICMPGCERDDLYSLTGSPSLPWCFHKTPFTEKEKWMWLIAQEEEGEKKKQILKCHMSIFSKAEDVFICARTSRSLQGYSIQSVYLYSKKTHSNWNKWVDGEGQSLVAIPFKVRESWFYEKRWNLGWRKSLC